MAYTSRKSSFSAPATVPACYVSPPSVVRTNVPPVSLTQTTLPLTMLKPFILASLFFFFGFHWALAIDRNNGGTLDAFFDFVVIHSCHVCPGLPSYYCMS